MKNEKGMALITVLLTIVITMVLLGTITSMTISTGEQMQRTQENIQAESLAVMGQEYIFSSFEAAKERAAEEEDTDALMDEWAENRAAAERALGEGRYIVTVTKEKSLTYGYRSTGMVDGQKEIMEGTLTVTEEETKLTWQERIIKEKNNIENSFTDDDKIDACDGTTADDVFESDDYWLISEQCKKGTNEDLKFEEASRLWLQGSLVMKGNNSMEINGFTYFDLSSLTMNGGNTISVHGDAYMDATDFNDVKMEGQGQISIHGNLYIEGELSRDVNICVDGKTNGEDIPGC